MDNNIFLLPTAKTEILNGFDDLKAYTKERLIDLIFEKVDKTDTRDKRKHKIFRVLEEEIPEIPEIPPEIPEEIPEEPPEEPEEHKHLLAELEELYILDILPICDNKLYDK